MAKNTKAEEIKELSKAIIRREVEKELDKKEDK